MKLSKVPKYRLAQASAWLNLSGAFLLFLSFQATSTNLFLVTAVNGNTAFCVGNRAMFVMRPDGGLGMGTSCPIGAGKPTAVVNTDSPALVMLGWGLLLLGFIFQLFSIE